MSHPLPACRALRRKYLGWWFCPHLPRGPFSAGNAPPSLAAVAAKRGETGTCCVI